MFPDFLSLVSTLRDCNKKQYIGIQKLETVQVPGSHVQHKYQVHERVCVNQNDVSTNPSRRIRKVYLLLICLCHPSSHILACACSYAYACIVYGNQPLGILNLFCGHYKKPNSQKTLSSWELVWLVIKELAWLVIKELAWLVIMVGACLIGYQGAWSLNMGACLIGYQGACLIGLTRSLPDWLSWSLHDWLSRSLPDWLSWELAWLVNMGACLIGYQALTYMHKNVNHICIEVRLLWADNSRDYFLWMAFTQEITSSYQNTCKVEYCMLIRNLTACCHNWCTNIHL